jgi:hypothetical protein
VGNPRENASAIILRNCKEVETPVNEVPTSSEQDKEKDVDITMEKSNTTEDDAPKRKFPPLSDYKPVAPFP